ncbi:fimbria/pilus outer membrane usher protein [Herbaspirillum robiniae]|uniref:fimbria/pilus outer membrane usher protein n=1 Tax=Herbaspirillum robiniae TaxID=2014887 RepID=UPI001FAF6B70|nr:fimbria/pilus outer membrane usher protein [Herbaspirillum robiniae]
MAQVEFGNDFLWRDGHGGIDTSRFGGSNPVIPGSYRVDLYVNGAWMGRQDVVFRTPADGNEASACFTRSLLDAVGVDFAKLSPETIETIKAAGANSCLALENIVPDATVKFDSGDLRMDIGIPQISMRRSARGYVSPELWDKGVTAGMLSYNFNAYRTSFSEQTNTSYYLGLNGGLNLGDWRLRNSSSVMKQSSGGTRFQTIASYAQRSIVPLSSMLTVGDFFTSGQLFDSISYRGVQMASDPRMLPESQTGYAPVVRGVARSNAKVRISQNGVVIYETTVSPGQFEITDLNPTGFGGDLQVVVTEADGAQSSFSVPYASVAQLLRPGSDRYSVIAGRTRSNGSGKDVNFVQSTYERGISNELTLFGGTQLAPEYLALTGGSAFSTPIGAMSASVTQSHAKVGENDTRNGQSMRLDYSKFLESTDTNFTLAAYRYSSSGFLRLQDLIGLKQLADRGQSLALQDRQRSQFQLNITQRLGEGRGSFYLTGSSLNYWNRPGSTTQYQIGYSNNWSVASYSLALQRQRDLASGQTNTQYFASMSLPLGREIYSPMLSTSMSRDSRSGTAMQATLNGTAGEDNAFSYGVSSAKNPGNVNSSVNAQYRAPYATIGGSYGYGSGGSRQMSAQVSGALVAHAGGVILSQALGDTIAIVEAQAAGGAMVNSSGVRVSDSGYAVVPYLTPYRTNEVVVDPKGTSTDVEMKVTSQRVAPYAGAVVLMKYETASGRSLLIKAIQSGGDPVPFGAEVRDERNNVVGMAGQGGIIFVRLAEQEAGALNVKWGNGRKEQCSLDYAVSVRGKVSKDAVMEQISATCETPAEVVKRKNAPEMVSREGGAAGKS